MFEAFLEWRERRRAMRQLSSFQKEEAQELAVSDTNPLLQAKMALGIDDPEGALQFWQQAWVRYPGYVKQAPETIDVLLGLKLFDDAETIMLEGQKRSPYEARYAEGYALVAEHRGDREEAVARWQQVRKRFPGSWMAYVNAARTLRELGRPGEAERLLKVATSSFPTLLVAWLEYARVAEDFKNWKVATSRWEQVSDRFGHVIGLLGQARVMVVVGRPDEAERMLLDARTKFEYDSDVAVTWARLAERRGNLEQALERWTFVRRRFPQFIAGFRESARLLQATGKIEQLQGLLRDAAERFPAETWPQMDRASLADQKYD